MHCHTQRAVVRLAILLRVNMADLDGGGKNNQQQTEQCSYAHPPTRPVMNARARGMIETAQQLSHCIQTTYTKHISGAIFQLLNSMSAASAASLGRSRLN